MAKRSPYDNVAIDLEGDALDLIEVSVYDSGTTDYATIYPTRNGGTPKDNPFETDITGLIQFWAEPGSYDIALHDTQTLAPRISDRTVPWEAISGDVVVGGISGLQIEDGAIGTNKLASLAVTHSKLAPDAVLDENIASNADVDGAKLRDESVAPSKIIGGIPSSSGGGGGGGGGGSGSIVTRGHAIMGTGSANDVSVNIGSGATTRNGAQTFVTLSLSGPGDVLIIATASIGLWSSINQTLSVACDLWVDGTLQQNVGQITSEMQHIGSHGSTAHQSWPITLASGSHTLTLRAYKWASSSYGSAAHLMFPHGTKLSYIKITSA